MCTASLAIGYLLRHLHDIQIHVQYPSQQSRDPCFFAFATLTLFDRHPALILSSMPLLRVFRTRGLPILQQLQYEEAILRADTGNWLIVNDGCQKPSIVLGISGDPEKLTHTDKVKAAGVQLLKRFSGGGTVVVDSNTVFSTLIFEQSSLPDVDAFPNSIMEFTGELYSDVFNTLERNPNKVCRTNRNEFTTQQHLEFKLQQNDYVFGDRKVGGNAQAITKQRWLHHTSFLWDFKRANMALLKEPSRRPEYRGTRSHTSFLCPLASLGFQRQDFIEGIEDAFIARGFDSQLVSMLEMNDILKRDHLKVTREVQL